mmetsp:Transcript_53843/g.114992  ORF Transcript_53843/g.114992 Transcript_53843/m.114992 type:complete len:87 (-) Transcript_53843:377-637(-)
MRTGIQINTLFEIWSIRTSGRVEIGQKLQGFERAEGVFNVQRGRRDRPNSSQLTTTPCETVCQKTRQVGSSVRNVYLLTLLVRFLG